jgi:hypothetical protein
LIIFVITLSGILYPVIKERLRQKKPKTGELTETTTQKIADPRRARLSALFGFIILALLAMALWKSRNFGFRAGLFPWVIGYPVLLLAGVQLFLDLTGRTRFKAEDFSAVAGQDLPTEAVYSRTTTVCGWIVGYFAAIWLLGFSLAVPLATLLYLKLAGSEKWPITIALSAIGWIFFYALFAYTLHVPFPDGAIFTWFN